MSYIVLWRELKKRGISQSKFARMCDMADCSISRIVRGVEHCGPSRSKRIAKALDWEGDWRELFEPLKESNYSKLFGTPERAARTLEEFELDQLNWCHGTDACEKCPYEFDRYGCCLPEGFSLLEWLKGRND